MRNPRVRVAAISVGFLSLVSLGALAGPGSTSGVDLLTELRRGGVTFEVDVPYRVDLGPAPGTVTVRELENRDPDTFQVQVPYSVQHPEAQTPPVTTTSAPPPTTTVTPTTTTVAPPTTVAPATTTTVPAGSGDPAPPTGDSFDIILRAKEDPLGPRIDLWRAPYFRQLNSAVPGVEGAQWTDGDRDGYRAAVMFLLDQGLVVGRVTFVGGYTDALDTAVFDDRMADHTIRLYDGSIYTGGLAEANDIPIFPSHGDQQRPDERWVIRYVHEPTGRVIEVRSYVTTVVAPGTEFNLLDHVTTPFTDVGRAEGSIPHTVWNRVTIGSYFDGLEAVNVYYDILHPDYVLTAVLP